MIPQLTPAKKPFTLPDALAKAVANEWQGKKKFSAIAMPLTSLAFTAIDRIGDDKENMVEVLLAYVDTDTLCYRASQSQELLKLQKAEWDPILAWAGAKFSALWQTTDGVMPLEQPKALHDAIKTYLTEMDDMRLAACGVLASLLSSLVLAVAVVEKKLSTEAAFKLSRLEETFQAEQWGEDEDAARRARGFLEEIKAAGHFLALLEPVRMD